MLTRSMVALGGVLLWTTWACGQGNPYGVSGANWAANGVMNKLGMPGGAGDSSGSIAYIWDRLQDTNVANMVRPKRYWEYVGADPDRIQGYDHITDTMTHPVEFGQWVDDHPGMIWIVGNEPDMGAGQDGLTTAEYARMYHTVYDFIHSRDETARFATAGLGALAYTSWLNDDIAWWNAALGEYQSQFGTDMPIDIWNSHCYAILGTLDPDRAIDVYFEPFMNYTRTVSNGLYANTEFWVTEFGLGPDIHRDLGAEFAAQLCPRLEALGVDRFFWFLGPYASSFEDEALLGADGQPNVLGQTYAVLANSYPNPIPPPPPSWGPFPAGPARLENDFETDEAPFDIMAGDYILDAGAYRQIRQAGACWMAAYVPYTYEDARVEVDVKLNAVTDPTNWAGITLRGGWIWQDGDTQTYLVFLRQNGTVGIYTSADGEVASAPGAVADTAAWHRLGVVLIGTTFEVTMDGATVLTWTDPHARKSSGIVSLRTCRADASFDDVLIVNVHTADLDLDGDVDQTDFGRFQLCYTGAGVVQNDPACARARLDDDEDVDQADFALFQRCFGGADVLAGTSCTD